ncbi:MAG TPA: sulfite exporter TauE/SafE family protein [Acidimicrobiales bacterium]|nr:sulfite exporter TauE/SafE family protein [Acidimicrobiales bacterium]
MHPGLLRDVLTVVAGVFTGVLSAAFGIGGATVSTPAIRLLGASALVAVGTTLPSILPSALTGTYRYAQAGLIRWGAVRWCVPTGIVAAVGGSLLSRVVPGHGHWLMILTAVLLAFTAARMARDRPSPNTGTETADERSRETPLVLSAVGTLAGLMSGLLGIGGGVVMVPGFTELAGMPLKAAIATSLACVGIFAIPSTITHALLGDIDWRLALLLTVGVVPGARLGAAAAIKATDRTMRIAVALFLGVVSVIYGVGELLALMRT